MKFQKGDGTASETRSPSARKVWIEINAGDSSNNQVFTSPSARKVWIEMICRIYILRIRKSPSARKVWIEIILEIDCLISVMSPSARKVWIEISMIIMY